LGESVVIGDDTKVTVLNTDRDQIMLSVNDTGGVIIKYLN